MKDSRAGGLEPELRSAAGGMRGCIISVKTIITAPFLCITLFECSGIIRVMSA